MKIAIAGAGGVGGYYGGILAEAGHEVVLLARGDHLRAIQQNGLSVRDPDRGIEILTRPLAQDSFSAPQEPADLVLLTAKTYDTVDVLAQIEPLVGPNTILLSLQNGVESEGLIAEAFGPQNVLGGLCYLGAKVTAPGVIEQSVDGQIVFGELSGVRSERAQSIFAVFEAARIKSTLSDGILVAKWSKLAWNAPYNQMCAVADITVGELLDDAEFLQGVRDVIGEVRAVASANGTELPADLTDKQIQVSQQKFRGLRPSLSYDLSRGRRTEHDAFGGFVSRQGIKHRLPTPVNHALHAFLNGPEAKVATNRSPRALRSVLARARA